MIMSGRRRVHDELLSVAQVLEELGVPRSTFYRWRQLRIAPSSIKLPNGQVRIRRSELEDWLLQLEDAA